MATGPEHFVRAEELARSAMRQGVIESQTTNIILLAQVHATLALAAAQVEDMESTELRPGWAEIVDGLPSSDAPDIDQER